MPSDYKATSTTAGISKAVFPTSKYYTFNDGIMFILSNTAAGCKHGTTAGEPDSAVKTVCTAYIDVNGGKSPNTETTCDSGTGGANATACVVSTPSDIYPVYIYDTTVVPATEAAKAVLYGK
jgi:hypothetical protein